MSKDAMKLVVDKIKSTFWEGYLPEPVKPAQQDPVQNNPLDCGVYLGSGKDYAIKHHVSYKPAQQEPVAWRYTDARGHYRYRGFVANFDKKYPMLKPQPLYTSPPAQQEPFGYFKAEPFGWTDCAETDEGAVALYERPAQRTWVGLTDEEMDDCWNKLFGTGNYNRRNVYRAIEARLKEKNT